jgi:DNA-binding NtrC family response regulator
MDAAILLIDDEPDVCELLSMSLQGDGARVTATTSVKEALHKVAHESFDVVLTDLGMKEMDGLEVCRRIRGTDPNLPVVVITGLGTMESAILAMRAGAYDYIPKPIEPRLLTMSIERALQHKRAHAELRRLRETLDRASAPPGGIIGASRSMQAVHSVVERVGASDAAVLIQGETGVGKELVARRIHETSARPSGPFVAINCAAVAPSLLESELFGHARGAFTDARSERVGLFVQANGGTLFLDEIGELPIEIQPHRGAVRRAPRDGDEPEPRERGAREEVPRGSLLPHPRRPHRRPAAAGARRGHPPPRTALPRRACCAERQGPRRPVARGGGEADGVHVARKCA